MDASLRIHLNVIELKKQIGVDLHGYEKDALPLFK